LPNYSATPPSDNVILALESINSAAKGCPEVEEFKYSGRQYIRCKSLTLGIKNTKPCTLPIWKWGEDVQLKGAVGDRKKVYYYYYIYKRARRQQELIIISLKCTTALNHLINNH